MNYVNAQLKQNPNAQYERYDDQKMPPYADFIISETAETIESSSYAAIKRYLEENKSNWIDERELEITMRYINAQLKKNPNARYESSDYKPNTDKPSNKYMSPEKKIIREKILTILNLPINTTEESELERARKKYIVNRHTDKTIGLSPEEIDIKEKELKILNNLWTQYKKISI